MDAVTLQAPAEETWAAVCLRPITPEDVDDILAASQDPQTQRYTTVPVPYERENALEFLAKAAEGWKDGTHCILAVDVAGRYSGSFDLRPHGDGIADVGYGIAPWARGLGLGSAALRLLCRWGFEELELDRIIWEAVAGNWPSRRTAERVGFRYTGQVTLDHRGEQVEGWEGELLPAWLR